MKYMRVSGFVHKTPFYLLPPGLSAVGPGMVLLISRGQHLGSGIPQWMWANDKVPSHLSGNHTYLFYEQMSDQEVISPTPDRMVTTGRQGATKGGIIAPTDQFNSLRL